MKFLLFPGRGIGVKGPRKAKSFRTNGGNGVFSLRPSEKLQLANAKASWKRTRFRPINEYSRIQATFNERCNLLALLRTRSSCGFQLIGPTIFDWHRDWQRAERDAIFGGRFHPPISHISKLYGSFMDFARRTCPPLLLLLLLQLDFSLARTRLYQATRSCMPPSSSRALCLSVHSRFTKYSRRRNTISDYFKIISFETLRKRGARFLNFARLRFLSCPPVQPDKWIPGERRVLHKAGGTVLFSKTSGATTGVVACSHRPLDERKTRRSGYSR